MSISTRYVYLSFLLYRFYGDKGTAAGNQSFAVRDAAIAGAKPNARTIVDGRGDQRANRRNKKSEALLAAVSSDSKPLSLTVSRLSSTFVVSLQKSSYCLSPVFVAQTSCTYHRKKNSRTTTSRRK